MPLIEFSDTVIDRLHCCFFFPLFIFHCSQRARFARLKCGELSSNSHVKWSTEEEFVPFGSVNAPDIQAISKVSGSRTTSKAQDICFTVNTTLKMIFSVKCTNCFKNVITFYFH